MNGSLTVTCTEFEKLYGKKLRRYARRKAAELGLPGHMREDLYQACWLVVGQRLKTWRDDGGMSAYNWCCSAMNREMTAEFRRYHENPAYGWRREMHYFLQAMGDREAVAEDACLDLKIDLHRLIDNLPRGRNLERFIRLAVNEESGAEMALESKQTRQAVNHANRLTAKHLASKLAEFENDRPSMEPEARRGIGYTCRGVLLKLDTSDV